MKPACQKAWDHYEEGRITATGFIIDFLNAADPDDLGESLERLACRPPGEAEGIPPGVLARDRVFRQSPPRPDAVAMAREVLANR